MARRVRVSDKITTVQFNDWNARLVLVHDHVANAWSHAFAKAKTAGVEAFSEEGLTWIRGHHAADAPVGRALLVAYALTYT